MRLNQIFRAFSMLSRSSQKTRSTESDEDPRRLHSALGYLSPSSSRTNTPGRRLNRRPGPVQPKGATPKRGPYSMLIHIFGFAKVRYRGLDKNAHRLFVACALANLFMERRHLLQARPA